MKYALLVFASCCLIAVECAAFEKTSVRPAGKGAKIGALRKNYVVLTRPYVWGLASRIGFWSEGLPAGVYRIKFEDDQGFYLPAPANLGVKIGSALSEDRGGLYVRKDKPTVFYRYLGTPGGDIDRPGAERARLPRDFASNLRQ